MLMSRSYRHVTDLEQRRVTLLFSNYVYPSDEYFKIRCLILLISAIFYEKSYLLIRYATCKKSAVKFDLYQVERC